MASILKRQLVKRLAMFTENFREKDLNISMFSGEGELTMLELNCAKLHEVLSLPACVILSKIVATKVKIKIHWTKLSSKPISIVLDGVTVQIELSNDTSRVHQQKAAAEALNVPTKYGMIEKMVDGISIQIRSIVVLCKATPRMEDAHHRRTDADSDIRLPHLLINISRIDLQSVNSRWQTEKLDKCQNTIRDGKQVIMYKRLMLQALSFELTPNGPNNQENVDASMSLEINPLEVRLTTRKYTATSFVAAVKTEVVIDNAFWELRQNQINVAHNFVRSVSHLVDQMALLEYEMYGGVLLPNEDDVSQRSITSEGSAGPRTNAAPSDQVQNDAFASSVRLYIAGLVLRLARRDALTHEIETVALLQLDRFNVVHHPLRQYNTLGDDWVTALHGVGPSVDNSVRESVSTITCADIVIIPLCHSEDVHSDYMKMLNKEADAPHTKQRKDLPLLTLFFASYTDATTGTWSPMLPAPTCWVHVRAIEITVNPYQWKTMLEFFDDALQDTPIPSACKLPKRNGLRRYTSEVARDDEDSPRATPDTKIILSHATLVLPPFKNTKASGEAVLQIIIEECQMCNRETAAGSKDHLLPLTTDFVSRELFNDAKVHYTNVGQTARRPTSMRTDRTHRGTANDAFQAYKAAAIFPHSTTDAPITGAINRILMPQPIETRRASTFRIDLRNVYCVWQAASKEPLEQIVWPLKATILLKKLPTDSSSANGDAELMTSSGLCLIDIDGPGHLTVTNRQFHYLVELIDVMELFMLRLDEELLRRSRAQFEYSMLCMSESSDTLPDILSGQNGPKSDVQGGLQALILCLKLDMARLLLIDPKVATVGPEVNKYKTLDEWIDTQREELKERLLQERRPFTNLAAEVLQKHSEHRHSTHEEKEAQPTQPQQHTQQQSQTEPQSQTQQQQHTHQTQQTETQTQQQQHTQQTQQTETQTQQQQHTQQTQQTETETQPQEAEPLSKVANGLDDIVTTAEVPGELILPAPTELDLSQPLPQDVLTEIIEGTIPGEALQGQTGTMEDGVGMAEGTAESGLMSDVETTSRGETADIATEIREMSDKRAEDGQELLDGAGTGVNTDSSTTPQESGQIANVLDRYDDAALTGGAAAGTVVGEQTEAACVEEPPITEADLDFFSIDATVRDFQLCVQNSTDDRTVIKLGAQSAEIEGCHADQNAIDAGENTTDTHQNATDGDRERLRKSAPLLWLRIQHTPATEEETSTATRRPSTREHGPSTPAPANAQAQHTPAQATDDNLNGTNHIHTDTDTHTSQHTDKDTHTSQTDTRTQHLNTAETETDADTQNHTQTTSTSGAADKLSLAGMASLPNYPAPPPRLNDLKAVVTGLHVMLDSDMLARIGDFVEQPESLSDKASQRSLAPRKSQSHSINDTPHATPLKSEGAQTVMQKQISVLNSSALLINNEATLDGLPKPPPLQIKLDDLNVACSADNVWTVGKAQKFSAQSRRSRTAPSSVGLSATPSNTSLELGGGTSNSFIEAEESPMISAYRRELAEFASAVHQAQMDALKALNARRDMKLQITEMQTTLEESKSVQAQTALQTEVKRLKALEDQYKEEMAHRDKLTDVILNKFKVQREEYEKLCSSAEANELGWRNKLAEMEAEHVRKMAEMESGHTAVIVNIQNEHEEQLRNTRAQEERWKVKFDEQDEEMHVQVAARKTMTMQMSELLNEKEDEIDILKRKMMRQASMLSQASLQLQNTDHSPVIQRKNSSLSQQESGLSVYEDDGHETQSGVRNSVHNDEPSRQSDSKEISENT